MEHGRYFTELFRTYLFSHLHKIYRKTFDQTLQIWDCLYLFTEYTFTELQNVHFIKIENTEL